MRAGTLRDLVAIERPATEVPNASDIGEPDPDWVTYATAYAQIQPLLGREFLAAEQVQSKVDTKIRLRYMPGVTDGVSAAMRVVFGSTIYNIEAAINVDNRNEEWLLMCSTGVNQG